MEEEYAAEFYEEGREVKMKNRLHNPCPTCVEYDFCQAYWACDSRIRYLQKRRQIRAHMEEIMERARRERDNGHRQLSQER